MNYTFKNDEIYVMKDDNTYLIHTTFPLYEEGVVNIDHTFVAPELRGTGEASKMMVAALEHIKSMELQVVATCPYAVVWLKRHKEYDDMIRHDLMEHMNEACKII